MPVNNALTPGGQNALGAAFGYYPQFLRQGQRARELAQARDVNTLPDPRTYAAVQAFLGKAPDELGFSVMHPDYQGIRNVADPAYALGLAAVAAPFTKGLPVGMSIKSVAPQEEALRLAQQRAALPPSKGGLGLPANNTAQQRAEIMFPADVYHGSRDPSIMAFDPSLAGKSTSNAFEQNIWATSSPEVARGYSLDTKQFALTPQAKKINAQIQGLSEKYNAAYQSGKFDEMDRLREQINVAQSQSKDLYKSFLKGDIASEGATIYPLRMSVDDLMPYEAGGKNWMSVNRKALEEAKARGYGGVNIKNVSDNTQASNKVISDTYATENPDLFRSRFAAFDPWRKTAATATAFGVAAPDLLAAENKNDINQMRKLKANKK